MRLLTAIIFIIALSGCANVSKWRDSRTSESDSTAVEVIKETTATKTTIRDVVDTTVTVKGNEAVAVRPLEELLSGKPIEAENNWTKVYVTYDPETETVRAEARTEDLEVPVKIDRTTETEATSESVTDSKSEVRSEEAVNTEEKIVEQKSKFWLGVAVAVIFMFLLVILIMLARQYFRRPI